MRTIFRVALTVLAVLAIVLAASYLPVLAQGSNTPPEGFCTTPPPDNPGWQFDGPAPQAPCGESSLYAMSMEEVVYRGTWEELNGIRGTKTATLYYEGAQVAQPTVAPMTVAAPPTVVPTAVIQTTAPAATSEPAAIAVQTAVVLTTPVAVADHWVRLVRLDPTFRSQGLEAWLRAAGFTWTSLTADARQIEEETSPDSKIYASGIQVNVVGLSIPYPACMTTDKAVTAGPDTRVHQPDQRNPSKLWTEVPSFSGTATLWVDCSNWGQLAPPSADTAVAMVAPSDTPASTAMAVVPGSVEEISWLQQMLQLIQMRLNQLLGGPG